MKFSVLMSIYNKEKKEYFNKCMKSIWFDQTLKPDEIILVKDGKLTNELYLAIDYWRKNIGNALKIVTMKKNSGLAKALNEGLKKCKYDYIARMDTDDISTPQRFEKQLKFLVENKNIDVVGTFISEIDENDILLKKEVSYPLTHKDLYQFFKKRNPLAHPATMFRKRFFKKAENYPTCLLFEEDTLLWYHGFLRGCQFANLGFIGLKFRRSSNFYQRRANYAKSIGLLQYRLFKINRNLDLGIEADFYAVLYFIVSISPSGIKKLLYKALR